MNLKVNFLRKCATLLVVSFVSVGALFAQDVNVSGTITSSEDSGPLPGASVLEKGTTRGTITNIDGYYQITVPKGTVLIFSFIGMEEQEIKVDASQTLNVVMDPATEGIGEVVVTALGIEREAKALGYAATKVQGEELAKVNTINPVSALQGKAAGLSISGSDGGIFGSSKIEIRGVSTLNNQNNQPIFVVDGVILENDIANVGHYDWAGDANDFGNMLKNLNVDNYESVNVLKGSAATALYGSRGINGAIVIKTKDGKGAKGFGIVVSQTFSVDHVYNQPDFQTKYGPGNYYGNRPYTGDSFGQGYYTTLKNGSSVPSLISAGASRMFGPKYDPNVQIEDYDGTMIP